MFATVSRARAAQPQSHRERDAGPSEEQRSRGVDSCYGVKSLMSEWDDEDGPEAEVEGAEAAEVDVMVQANVSEIMSTAEERSNEHDDAHSGGDTSAESPPCQSVEPEKPSESAGSATEYTPLSFESLSTHAQSHDPVSEPSSPASFTSIPTSSYLSASISSLSRSSSPTGSSFDLTHRSSGRGYARSQAVAQASHLSQSFQSGHDASLVLPTMSLPSSSLHFSVTPLPRGPGEIQVPIAGVMSILVAGAQRHTTRFVRDLTGYPSVQLFELESGQSATREIGVFKAEPGPGDGSTVEGPVRDELTMLACLRILNVEHGNTASVRTLINDTFQPLQQLLHYSSNPESTVRTGSSADKQLLRPRVEQWAADQRGKVEDGFRSWLDLAVFAGGDAVDELDEDLLETLVSTLPTVVSSAATLPRSFSLFTMPEIGTSTAADSPSQQWSDPTPRCDSHHDVEGYFSSRPETPTSSDGSSGSGSPEATTSLLSACRLVDILLGDSVLNQRIVSDIHKASTASFLAWTQRPSRSHPPSHPLASSRVTATSLNRPTPTLAQGGGEWEAGLSRRVAARRQSEMRPRHGGQSFRGHAPHAGLELFPRGVPSIPPSSLTQSRILSSLISSIFYPLTFLSQALSAGPDDDADSPKDPRPRPRWSRLVVAACAVGIVLCGVGVSYWVVR